MLASFNLAGADKRGIAPRNETKRNETLETRAKLEFPPSGSRIAEIAAILRAEPPIRNNARPLFSSSIGRDTIKHSEADFTRCIAIRAPREAEVRAIARSRDDITVTVRAQWISINSPSQQYNRTNYGTLPRDRFRPFRRGKWEGLARE